MQVGGRLVYSTCSLNPIENEAVVASVLRTFGTGCVRLVNCSDALPGLPRRPGLRTWGVWHRGGFHQTWEALQERCWEKCPPLQSCFPPADPAELADGDGGFHLEHCVRLMPHDLNGSGFFVAVLEKVLLTDTSRSMPPACYSQTQLAFHATHVLLTDTSRSMPVAAVGWTLAVCHT